MALRSVLPVVPNHCFVLHTQPLKTSFWRPSLWNTTRYFPPYSDSPGSKKTNITLWKYKRAICVLVVDGSIPLKITVSTCMVAGRPSWIIAKAADGAAAIYFIGSCSAWGGVAAAGVNPTGAVSLQEVLPGKAVISSCGFVINPRCGDRRRISPTARRRSWNAKNRPTFAYGRHDS
ncbi:hypothetical protein KCP77_05770 [Salmonella enterica subsp. enterica]|nr:hypothetical protein KCP77_05770 [Salmonella enterica subsp. enterica]